MHLWMDPLTVEFWAVSRDGIQDAGWFRLFSAVLGHAGWLHLAGNVLGLVLLGSLLEPRLGSLGLLGIVCASGLGGSIASTLANDGASIGASGGVYGLFGAWLVLGGRVAAGRRFARPRLPPRIWLLMGFLLVLENVRPNLGLWPSEEVARTGIDWAAHLGGAVTGAALSGAIRASTDAWSRAGPRWIERLALVLLGLYALGLSWGGHLYDGGSPAALAYLSDGPAKWIAINNRAWAAASTAESDPDELELWRDQMKGVIGHVRDQPEFLDTFATLQHRLGAHHEAATLERHVSWRHETPMYVQQFARFAWAALREDLERGSDVRVPLRILDSENVELSLPAVPSHEPGIEIDVLCWAGEAPLALALGLVRVSLGPGSSGRLRFPREIVHGKSAPPVSARLACATVHAQPSDRSVARHGTSARYWPIDTIGSETP